MRRHFDLWNHEDVSANSAKSIRVPDCWAAYRTLRSRGVEFLTEPHESAWEVRCFFRDPDGHLFEISQRKG